MFKMKILTGNSAFRNSYGETNEEMEQLDPIC